MLTKSERGRQEGGQERVSIGEGAHEGRRRMYIYIHIYTQ